MMYILMGMALTTAWNSMFFSCHSNSSSSSSSKRPGGALLRGGAQRARRPPAFKLVSARRHHLQVLLHALRDRGFREAGTPGAEWGAAVRDTRQWDLLWSFGYTRFAALGPLQGHHRVNHLPGGSTITIKSSMWMAYKERRGALAAAGVDVARDYTWVPRHFVLPRELPALERALLQEGGDGGHQWLLKRQSHRGVRLVGSVADARAVAGRPGKEAGRQGSAAAPAAVFAAEYVPPLLLDGRKWDIGMYVVVPSVDPLRAWVHRNALLRFCKLAYPTTGGLRAGTPTDAYVVNDYVPPWEQPSLRAAFEGGGMPSTASQGANGLDAVVAWMRGQPGLATAATALRAELHRAIVLALAEARPAMRRGAARWSPRWGRSTFFELFRFDFSVDARGKPWLMEVNMSPNLMPHLFAAGNDEGLKRSVLDGMLDLVGGVDANARSAAKRPPPSWSADRCPPDCAAHAACASAVASPRCWACRRWFTAADEEQLHRLGAEMERAAAPDAAARDFELIFPPSSARSWAAMRLAPLRQALLDRVASPLETCLLEAVLAQPATAGEEGAPDKALARILQGD